MANNVARYLVNNLLKINPKFSIRIAPIRTSTIIINNREQSTTTDSTKSLPPAFDPDYHDIKGFRQFLDDCHLGPKAVYMLYKFAGVPRNIAREVVKDFPLFEKLSKSDIVKNYEALLAGGLISEQIKEHPYILADTPDDLALKISMFNQMKLDFYDGIRLFQIPARRFSRYLAVVKDDKQVIPEFNSRIEYLANKLETTPKEICDRLPNRSQVLGVPMEKIVSLTKIFLDSGMPKSTLKEYLHLYALDYSRSITRAQTARELKITPLTPWFVRCPDEKFEEFVGKYRERRNVEKPYENINDYVMALFKCSASDIESLYRRDHRLRKINKKTLTDMFTFFHQLGYTFEELFISHRCFYCSQENLRKKYDLWIKNGLGRPPLVVISSSNGLFEKWLKKRTNKKIVDSSPT
ncbi:hypothetical protein G9C98_005302 [Cotesia typhae]|uniref:Uncharacterized protein n=1 Tax=Cotesia typhae TaxID=2053667 RepID=A0A8J5RAY2_9HYME|nr:hypothetical protein G9C98_005302 [Cotesia typhae]